MKPNALWLVLAGAGAACAPEFTYVPTTNATMVGSRVAADYRIPEGTPHGELELESYGMATIAPKDEQGDESLRALHLRAIVINNSATDWTFDTRAQQLDLTGHGAVVPVFASASAGAAPPLVVVPARGKRVVDLFFPLPPDEQHKSQLPAFEIVSRVQTDQGVATERTSFQRVEVEPADAYYASDADYGAGYYWGPPYWYNPYYYDYPIYGGYRIGPRYFGHPVGIQRYGGHFAPRGGGGGHR